MLQGSNRAIVRLLSILLVLGVMFSGTAFAQNGPSHTDRELPVGVEPLDPSERVEMTDRVVADELADETGPVQVVVRLSEDPIATAADPRTQLSAIDAEQISVLNQIQALDPNAKVLGQVRVVLNAIMVEIDATHLDALSTNGRIRAINPVVNYELALSETVPYIGATPDVQEAAGDGAGVKVAVLDSGIDYTHANLGGPGTLEAYEAAYGVTNDDPLNTTTDGLFPTERVVDGFDFVGEAWPNGDLAPDPDPIDFEGHGTHVADIIGGNDGVAPAVDLYAVKVCSAVASSCSGVALIQGMDFAADPNGDGRTNDRVDIINMSLGSSYGNAFFDDLSTAVQNATDLGILTVASAGNSADRPYIVGTPSGAPSALSVAQTNVPSAKQDIMLGLTPASVVGEYLAVFQPWSAPLTERIEGPVQYGDGERGNLDGCAPFAEGSLEGKIVLVDRGACNFSAKIVNIDNGGGIVGIIAQNSTGAPFPGGFGGGDFPAIPGFMISQGDGLTLKNGLADGVTVAFDPAVGIPLIGSMTSTSSRGPSPGIAFPGTPTGEQYGQLIKPEIGAPGASISAVAGSGDGTTAFGGTSGAAPMVSGAAALLIAEQDWDFFPPHEVKARLMNTAETEIYTNPAIDPGALAPITRIGNGEVRIDQAVAAGAAAWELNGAGASLSFGMVEVSRDKVLRLRRIVEVKNYTSRAITYDIGSEFRFADDEANGAVTIKPSRNRIRVPAYSSRYFTVRLEIDGTKLRPWTMNSGSSGGTTAELNELEYDGYLTFTDAGNADNNLHMAWHVLPRLSPNVVTSSTVTFRDGLATPKLRNRGVGDGSYLPFSLIGENTEEPVRGDQGSQNPNITARYLGATTFPASFCAAGMGIQFGVQTWTPVTHANYPLEIDIYLDTDRDGVDDAVIFTAELGLSFAADGRNVVYAGPVEGPYAPFFFTEHGTNSGAFALTVCGEQVGLSIEDAGTLVDVTAYTFDNYFTGELTSVIPGTMGVLNERYLPTDAEVTTILGTVDVPAKSDTTIGILDFGEAGTSPTESGLLLLNTSGGVNEALVIQPR